MSATQQNCVTTAYRRIKPYINNTPLVTNSTLNKLTSSKLFFKYEGMQKTGAFKARGALNTLLKLKESNKLTNHIVTYSSGNHAQAVAWACKILSLKATIFIPSNASQIKIQATKNHGADVILANTRQEAESMALDLSKSCFLLPPYDHDDVIAGQGTSALEAWMQEGNFDAVFAPCGGGGLISGTYLASTLFSQNVKVFACEPIIANDAATSYKTGTITKFDNAPQTIADGVRTLSISDRTFEHIKKLAGFYEITEENIIYWTQWLTHLLKVNIEPTSALGMAGAFCFLKESGISDKRLLIILSGGNIDQQTYLNIWKTSYLDKPPLL